MNEQEKAAVLAEFTDQLNQHGAESPLVKGYCQRYADPELQQLFKITVRLQSQLRQGEFRLAPGDESKGGPSIYPVAERRNKTA